MLNLRFLSFGGSERISVGRKRAAIPKGGLNDYGTPKARGGGRTVWNSEGKEGLSILEFPKARGSR